MTRSELRKNIFKIIFRMEFHQDEAMDEQLTLRLEELAEVLKMTLEVLKSNLIFLFCFWDFQYVEFKHKKCCLYDVLLYVLHLLYFQIQYVSHAKIV